MANVKRQNNESLESLLRRFNRSVNEDGILAEVKKHEFHQTKSQKRREKIKKNQVKAARAARMARRFRVTNED